MPKVLVLNLSRMGDLVQSVPFLAGLKRRTDAPEVHLLVEKAFVPVARLLPFHDAVHELSLDEWLPPLHQAAQVSPPELYHLFEGRLHGLQTESYDEVWNLTHTRPSMILTRLLGGENGRGVTVDSRGFQMVRSPWLRYFFATNLARPFCQFNLVDIYAQCAGPIREQNRLELTPDTSAEAFADAFWSAQNLKQFEPVAFQLGAAHPSKRWPVECFRGLAELIWGKLNRPVILLGHKTEMALAQPFVGMPGVRSLVGETSIPQLFSVLRRCAALVSNDTGTVHLAAAAGRPIIALTLGTALGSETAPYGQGHIVVEPDVPCFPCSYHRECAEMHCHDAVQIETVFETLAWVLGGRNGRLRNISPEARVYETAFNSQDRMLELRQLQPSTLSLRDQLHAVVRPLWRRVLKADGPRTAGQVLESSPEISRLRHLVERALPLVQRALVEADKLQSESRQQPLPVDNLWWSGQTLIQIDKALESVLDCRALLRTFWGFTALTKASLESSLLEEQVNETRRAYADLEFLLQGLKDSLEPNHEDLLNHKDQSGKEKYYEGASEWTRDSGR